MFPTRPFLSTRTFWFPRTLICMSLEIASSCGAIVQFSSFPESTSCNKCSKPKNLMTLKCPDSFTSLNVMRWKDETEFLASGLVLSFWSEDVGTTKASWLGICFISCLQRYCSEWYFLFCCTKRLDIKREKILVEEMFVFSEEQQTELDADLQPPAV